MPPFIGARGASSALAPRLHFPPTNTRNRYIDARIAVESADRSGDQAHSLRRRARVERNWAQAITISAFAGRTNNSMPEIPDTCGEAGPCKYTGSRCQVVAPDVGVPRQGALSPVLSARSWIAVAFTLSPCSTQCQTRGSRSRFQAQAPPPVSLLTYGLHSPRPDPVACCGRTLHSLST